MLLQLHLRRERPQKARFSPHLSALALKRFNEGLIGFLEKVTKADTRSSGEMSFVSRRGEAPDAEKHGDALQLE